MSGFMITLDGRAVELQGGETLLEAARKLNIDIPTLCYLKECGPLTSCLVCLVEVVVNGQGKMVPSCGTKATPGMVVESETEEVHEARRTALELLFSDHVGDCLSPCHRLCPLSLNIPQMIRRIECGEIDEAIAGVREALPMPGVLGRLCHHPCEQGCRRGAIDSPASIRELERFVADQNRRRVKPFLPVCRARSGKSVVVVGAGPAGLAAAERLARLGHGVTIVDRHEAAGGSLRSIPEKDLPRQVLDDEIAQLSRLGIQFKYGVELGNQVTIEGLLRGFDVILLTVGALAKGEGDKLGVLVAAGGVKADPNSCRTEVGGVFAAGAAVKPVKQLVKAISEGQSAAECIHQFLSHQTVRRPDKPFSSIMGRLDPGELKLFLRSARPGAVQSPCDACAGFSQKEAATEAGRCLHCDCRSSGACILQHYAQVYGADATRFRSDRRPFEQQVQPGGVIYEPGKCILCGICVKLTEQAREPLGLTFVRRGFNVRVAGPLDRTIEEGLQKVAQQCVEQCPTGALEFSEPNPAVSSGPMTANDGGAARQTRAESAG